MLFVFPASDPSCVDRPVYRMGMDVRGFDTSGYGEANKIGNLEFLNSISSRDVFAGPRFLLGAAGSSIPPRFITCEVDVFVWRGVLWPVSGELRALLLSSTSHSWLTRKSSKLSRRSEIVSRFHI